ncbi:hypothetical protein FF38_08015, partial [Lucilia cuprina]
TGFVIRTFWDPTRTTPDVDAITVAVQTALPVALTRADEKITWKTRNNKQSSFFLWQVSHQQALSQWFQERFGVNRDDHRHIDGTFRVGRCRHRQPRGGRRKAGSREGIEGHLRDGEVRPEHGRGRGAEHRAIAVLAAPVLTPDVDLSVAADPACRPVPRGDRYQGDSGGDDALADGHGGGPTRGRAVAELTVRVVAPGVHGAVRGHGKARVPSRREGDDGGTCRDRTIGDDNRHGGRHGRPVAELATRAVTPRVDVSVVTESRRPSKTGDDR